MSDKSFEAWKRARVDHGSGSHEDSESQQDTEAYSRNPVWTPEDIAEPEPWTLASFDDLVAHEWA